MQKSLRQLSRELGVSRTKIQKIIKECNIDYKTKFARINKETKEYIVLNKDKSSIELSNETGIPASTIRNIWAKNNICKLKTFNPNIAEFVAMYDGCKSSRELAKIFNVDKTTILNFAKKIGYDTKYVPIISKDDKDIIIKNYNKYTANQLAKTFNISKSYVSGIWHKNGLKGKVVRTYVLNEYYFKENKNLRQSYYWIGLIAADGCLYKRNGLNSLSITLQNRDAYILKEFMSDLGSDKPIYKREKYSTFEISSDKIFHDLSHYNITPVKTWKYYPLNINDKCLFDFLRGYFDGDGSIYCSHNNYKKPSAYNINFCGNLKIVGWISERLLENSIENTIVMDNRKEKYSHDFASLYINNIKSKYIFGKLIYEHDDGKHSLIRKKKLMSSMIFSIENNLTHRKENIVAVEEYQRIIKQKDAV